MSVVGAACFTAFPNLFRSNRASNGNLLVGVHQAVTPADFTAYCVTAPQDPGLPGGGQQISGIGTSIRTNSARCARGASEPPILALTSRRCTIELV